MISRVADSCFWITRYLERVDTMARLLGVTNEFYLDSSADAAEHWKPLVIVAGAEDDYVERIGAARIDDPEAVQAYLTWDADQLVSIHASLQAARENARTVREAMSLEMWEQINDLWLWLDQRSSRRLYDRDRDSFYDHLSKQCMLFHGIAYSTMLHEEPFVFMKLGRAVERVGPDGADPRRQAPQPRRHAPRTRDHGGRRRVARDPALLLRRRALPRERALAHGPERSLLPALRRELPRSVLHNLDRTRGLMARLIGSAAEARQRRSWQLLERFRGELLQMDVEDVLHCGIHRVLTWIVDSQAELCAAISDDYLVPPAVQVQVAQASHRHPVLLSQSQA